MIRSSALTSSANDELYSLVHVGDHAHLLEQEFATLLQDAPTLDAATIERIIAGIFVAVTETLYRIHSQASVLAFIAARLERPDATREQQTEMQTALDLHSLLCDVVHTSHRTILEFLRVCSDKILTLPFNGFLRNNVLYHLFLDQCAGITKMKVSQEASHQASSLQRFADGQARAYIPFLLDVETQRLSRVMHAASQKPRCLTAQEYDLVIQIRSCAFQDPPQWAAVWGSSSARGKTDASSDSSDSEEVGENDAKDDITINDSNDTDNDDGGVDIRSTDYKYGVDCSYSGDGDNFIGSYDSATSDNLFVDRGAFITPRLAIACIVGTSRFLQYISNIPETTGDIVQSWDAYIKAFDTHCRQMVSSGDVQHSVGSQSDNVVRLCTILRGLSLVGMFPSRVLSFVINHWQQDPYAEQDTIRDIIGAIEVRLMDLNDYVELAIVQEMVPGVEAASEKIRQIDWAKEIASHPRAYIQDLARKTEEFFTKLVGCLSTNSCEVKSLMTSVLDLYEERLGEAYRAACLQTANGRAW